MASPNLAVIVVNWRNYAITADCLTSIFASAYRPLTVIVVDNESEPARLRDLQARFPDVIYLPQDSNLGCGPARNRGIEKALERGADIISLIDDDVLITDNFFEELICAITSADDIGVVGPVNVFADAPNLVLHAGARLYDWLGYERWQWVRQPYVRLQTQLKPLQLVDTVAGAGMTVKREVFERIGMFHPWLAPCGPEDIEFCLRARDHGFRVVLASNVKLLHRASLEPDRGWHKARTTRKMMSIQSQWIFIGALRPKRYLLTSIAVHLARQMIWVIRSTVRGQWSQVAQIVQVNAQGIWSLVSGKGSFCAPNNGDKTSAS